MALATDYLADFRTMFPEFADVPDEQVLFWLDASLGELDECAWGSQQRFKMALLWLTAHELFLKQQIESGAVIPTLGGAKKVEGGEVDVEFTGAGNNLTSNGDAIYLQTRYGTEYVRLRDKTFAGGVFSYGCSC